MPEKQLRETLQDLEQTLERQGSVDPAARERLGELVQEIRELLAREPGEREETEPSLVDRLSEAMEQFEESHPSLTEAVGRLAAALSNLGI
ncbi:MAG: DUF4404 family protein [Myxococcales bacterium]|nr:DUF4404 family protein [Myxococcales bacterium]MDH5306149.1 DUF4404 family protein [Myxococcales bacterium]MDH5568114.1 DUF4404 family protein [Myxococcales bacterium]